MEPVASSNDGKRKHVTTACVPCRESKVKCNGATPTCSSCMSKGKECRYHAAKDKRKLSLIVPIELLSSRIRQLSRLMEDHGLEIPPMAPDEDRLLADTLHTLGLPDLRARPPSDGTESQTGASHRSPSTQTLSPGQPSETPMRQEQQHQQLQQQQQQQRLASVSSLLSPDDCDPSTLSAIRGMLHLASAPDGSGSSAVSDIRGAIPRTPGSWGWNMADAESVALSSSDSAGGTMMTQVGYMAPVVPVAVAAASAGVATHSSTAGFSNSAVTTSPNAQSVVSSGGPGGPGGPGGATSCPSMEMDDGMSSSGSVDELVDQLSDRVGTLHIRPGGHIRFYGSTSNLNLLKTPAEDANMNVHRTIRNDGAEHLHRLGISKAVPHDIERHLMSLYFTWQDPSFHVVDRAMFEEATVAWCERMEDTSYYSEALRNAICALGAAFDARHHPAFVTFPRSLADFFADRAKALLEIELDSPCVATIQALVLLSAHDVGCGRDARGWLFSGMAMRLSFNLALHQDLKPYVAKGVVTEAEAALRRTVFWAAFVVDHFWSFYLGQPFRMSMKGVSLDKPGRKSTTQMPGQWTPYVKPGMTAATATTTTTPMADYVDEVCLHQVLLFESMAPLSDTLYGSATTSRAELHELNALTVSKLLDWKASLPTELCLDLNDHEATYLPHVILLHMQYYQSLIYAHRPWMSKSRAQSQPPRGPGAGHARQVCMDAASAVAQLLRLYEERYTLRRINIQAVAITFSAALLLVFATVSQYYVQPDRADAILADLSVCFRALDELAPSWDTAKRARDFLIRLQRHWERQARSSSVAAAEAAAAAATGGRDSAFTTFSSARKRRRSSFLPGDGSPPVVVRDDMASVVQRESIGSDGMFVAGGGGMNGVGVPPVNFGMDLDFDWMLAMEGMAGNLGDVFSVPLPMNMAMPE